MNITASELASLARKNQIPPSFAQAWEARTNVNPVTLALDCDVIFATHRFGWRIWLPLAAISLLVSACLYFLYPTLDGGSVIIAVLMLVMLIGLHFGFRAIGAPLPDMSQLTLFCHAVRLLLEWSERDPKTLAALSRLERRGIANHILLVEANRIAQVHSPETGTSLLNALTIGLEEKIDTLGCLGFEVRNAECYYREMMEREEGLIARINH